MWLAFCLYSSLCMKTKGTGEQKTKSRNKKIRRLLCSLNIIFYSVLILCPSFLFFSFFYLLVLLCVFDYYLFCFLLPLLSLCLFWCVCVFFSDICCLLIHWGIIKIQMCIYMWGCIFPSLVCLCFFLKHVWCVCVFFFIYLFVVNMYIWFRWRMAYL